MSAAQGDDIQATLAACIAAFEAGHDGSATDGPDVDAESVESAVSGEADESFADHGRAER